MKGINIRLRTGNYFSSNTITGALDEDIETVEILINGKSLYCYSSSIGEADKNLDLTVNSTKINHINKE